MEPLEFDSTLFGARVARTTSLPTLEEARAWDLIYLTLEAPLREDILAPLGGVLVDARRVYTRPIGTADAEAPEDHAIPEIRVLHPDELPEAQTAGFVALGIEAAENSRFRRDPRIPEPWFQAMMTTWMRNSAAGELADALLVAEDAAEAGDLVGMATLRAGAVGTTVVGHLGVRTPRRGSGLGGRLLRAIFRHCARDRGDQRVELGTHGQVPRLCRLYERHGFVLAAERWVYHLWPSGRSGEEYS